MTLSKLTVSPIGFTKEQIESLPLTLERRASHATASMTLKIAYSFDGRPLGPDTHLQLGHTGKFQCTLCSRPVKKLFDGFCYPCLQSSAPADRCVLNPVGCHYVSGTCREPQWGRDFCYKPHYVYMAYTDKVKVGITRCQQVPTRWADQGATMAVLLARVGSRHQAGVLEHFLCERFADKSHWLKMLKSGNSRPALDAFNNSRVEALRLMASALESETRGQLTVQAPADIPQANSIELLSDAVVAELEYPLWNEIPEKVTSLSLDKTANIDSHVKGVKGQYLFLETGVFNVRRHEGYVVSCDIQNAGDQGYGA